MNPNNDVSLIRNHNNLKEDNLNVLESILNGMDAYIYVTDPVTDDILFINDKMSEHFDFKNNGDEPLKCWVVLQSGMSERCPFCPNHRLKDHPGETVVWEEQNTVTGRHYRNSDKLIKWPDGRLVHMQHSVDITEMKALAAAQQELMSRISQSFISGNNIEEIVTTALKNVGGFMGYTRVILTLYAEQDNALTLMYEWMSDGVVSVNNETSIPFRKGLPLFDNITAEGKPVITDKPSEIATHYSSGEIGIKSILSIPIYLNKHLFGLLEFYTSLDNYPWESSDLHLAEFLGGAIAGLFDRSRTQASLTKMSTLIDRYTQPVVYIDTAESVTYYNAATYKVFGYTEDELLAGGLEMLFGHETFKRVQTHVWPKAFEEGIIEIDLPLIHRNGKIRIFSFLGVVIHIEGELPQLATIGTDVTDLVDAKEAAEAANKAKSDFLSTMSHEIRTPMNAILGITDIQLQNERLDPNTREALERIHISGDTLLGIINDILDLSKIESGKLELVIDKYELASLISDTAQLNMMRIGSKPIEFELQIDERLPTVLLGDELRVKQVLNNILSNAFKYTASGTVRFKITAESDENNDNGDLVLITIVSDTGQGMTTEQVKRLFEKYTRFNMDANRTTEGTGLGMSITQNLLDMMNGDISVESSLGVGSTFTIRIPQGRVGPAVFGTSLAKSLQQFGPSSRKQMRRVQITREPMPYGRVLIVDDVETNIYVAKGLLTSYGLQIDSANSGYETIEKIKKGKTYDIIFMDHMMPKMDGIEATKRLRSTGYEGPIVALTANAVAGQADIFLGNGFDDFISKPIDIRQLNTVLNKFIRDRQPVKVVEAARNQVAGLKGQDGSDKDPPQAAGTQKINEAFLRDANKSLLALDSIMEKGSVYNKDDMRTYVIFVHGMKSALANIGNTELSAVARNLEALGRSGNAEAMSAETPAFLNSLRSIVADLTATEESDSDVTTDEDPSFLQDKLLAMKTACAQFDKKNTRTIISELKEKKWSTPTNILLSTVSEHLLHSDFDEGIAAIDQFLLLRHAH